FGTLAGGFLTDGWLGKIEPSTDNLASWSQMKYLRFIKEAGGWSKFQDLLRTLDKIGRRHHASIANVASRFVLDQPAVGGVIIGARPGVSDHLTDNIKIFELELDEVDRSEIRTSLAGLDPIHGDCGDEYRRPPYLTASGDLSHHVENMPAPYLVEELTENRSYALSGTVWEDLAGFSRAVRTGDRILVSGTTATHGERTVGGDDPAAQTHYIIDKIEGALISLGGSLSDVVRTRIFIENMDDWEPVARAHGSRFGTIRPANTLVQAGLIGSDYRVEIEAEAVIVK
ncbi:MAG: aldo/keto reductase, partial [Candidatus Latescibacteria bacterium]|nr:aldo/keto reductase [Candidatus Latescibacterota bacterium]